MNVVIIDDEQLAIDVLSIVLQQLPQFPTKIKGTFTDAVEVFPLLEQEKIDLIFLDMEMLEIHGIQIAQLIVQNYPNIQIIFVTAHAQFAIDAFDVQATDYLLKPVQDKRLEKALLKAQANINIREPSEQGGKKAPLYVRVFGSFQVIDDQQNTVKWRTKKVKELFLILWLHQEKLISNVVIMENLWPECDPEKASVNLHTTVYQLRKTLKPYDHENPIILINNQYQLRMLIASDYEKIVRLIEREHHNEQSIQQLLNGYEADFLESEEYDWAIKIRLRLRQAVVNILESYITSAQEINPLLKLNCLQKMLELEEYNEQYMYLLLKFLIEQNKQQACKECFAMITEKFTKELNLPIPINITNLYDTYMNRI